MSNKSENSGVAITVAVLALIGTLGAALIANWDAIAPRRTSSETILEENSSDSLSSSTEPGLDDNDAQQVTVDTENFSISLQGCERAASNVRCNFLVRSNEDMWIRLRRSRVIDISGNEYDSDLIGFGNDEGSSSVDKQLLENIPIKASLKFDNFSSQTTQIAVLQVPYSFKLGAAWAGMPSATDSVRFTNVTVTN